MSKKNNDHLKRRLEQDLPYPRLTVQADLKFDEILSMLPDKEEVSQKTETYVGTHYRTKAVVQEQQGNRPPEGVKVPKGMEYLEPEIKRPSKTRRILQVSMSVAAACLVLVVLFQLASLQVAKDLPGNNNFQSGSTPTESEHPNFAVFPDENEPAYTVKIHSATRRNNYVFLDTWLEFESEKAPETDQLFTGSLWELKPRGDITVTVDGMEAVLYRDPVFNRVEDGGNRFHAIVVAVLPEARGNTAEITVNHLYGVTDAKTHSPFDLPEIELTNSVTCSSSVEADPEYEYEISEEDRTTINEITFVDYSVTESRFTVWLKYPVREDLLYPTVTALAYANDGPIDTLGSFQEMSNGDRRTGMYTQEIIFQPLPERTTGVAVMVDYAEGNWGEYRVYYENGEILPPLPLAEFHIDLESGEVTCLEETDFVSYAGLTSVYAAGPRFHNHVMAYGWEADADAARLHLNVVTDLNIDLPLAAEIYYMGDLQGTLPLYRTGESVTVEDQRRTVYDNGEVLYYEAFWGNYGKVWNYILDLPLPENDWGTDGWTWNNFFEVKLRNVVTGEILGSTTGTFLDNSVKGKVFTIGTQEELKIHEDRFQDPLDWKSGNDMPYELPDPFTPAQSEFDAEAEAREASEAEEIKRLEVELDKALDETSSTVRVQTDNNGTTVHVDGSNKAYVDIQGNTVTITPTPTPHS